MTKVHIPPDLISEQLKGIHLNKEIKASILVSLIQSHFSSEADMQLLSNSQSFS